MRVPSLPSVTLDVRPRFGDHAADRSALLAAAADVAGAPEAALRLVRRCGHCGGLDHGRPEVIGADVHVSLARAPGFVALAVATSGPVGVDVERVSRVRAAALDVFTPAERVALDRADDPAVLATEFWTVKEAVLKADGRGLRVDPRSVDASERPGRSRSPGSGRRVAGRRGAGWRVAGWLGAGWLGAGWLVDVRRLDEDDDVVVAVAVAQSVGTASA